MKKKITDRFLAAYNDTSFVVLQRAKTLLVFDSILITLMPFAFIALNITQQREIISFMNIILVLIFATAATSLSLLRAGYYNWAANIIALLTTAGIVAMAFNAHSFKNADHLSIFYYLPVIIIFTSLFCKIGWVIGISVFFLVSGIVSYIRVKPMLNDLFVQVLDGSMPDYTFAIVLSFILCVLIMRINKTSNDIALKEADNNRQQFLKISGLLHSVQEISVQLAASSEEMSSAASSFAENAQTQASSSEEITSTIEEISAGIEMIAGNARNQSDMVSAMTERIMAFSGFIHDVSMKIQESLRHTDEITEKGRSGERSLSLMNARMKDIKQSSNDMNNIIEIINSIADQINLLSLNATIEAARAGDAGRGFAVVASEISRLADRTAASIKDISDLIAVNDREINTGISNILEITGLINIIVAGIAGINERLKYIFDFIAKQAQNNEAVKAEAGALNKLAAEIRNATEEQKLAIGEISTTIALINDTAQHSAIGAAEMSQNSGELSNAAENLKDRVNSF